MSKLIKTSNTSKGEKLLLKSFEDKISQGTKKSHLVEERSAKIRSRCHHYAVINIKE